MLSSFITGADVHGGLGSRGPAETHICNWWVWPAPDKMMTKQHNRTWLGGSWWTSCAALVLLTQTLKDNRTPLQIVKTLPDSNLKENAFHFNEVIPVFPHSDETQSCNLISDDAETTHIHPWLLLPQMRDCNVHLFMFYAHTRTRNFVSHVFVIFLEFECEKKRESISLFEDMINDTVQYTGSLCC